MLHAPVSLKGPVQESEQFTFKQFGAQSTLTELKGFMRQ